MPTAKKKRGVVILAVAAALLILLIPGGAVYYNSGGGESCAACHEIRSNYDVWTTSAHRNIDCKDCHGGTLTADLHFHTANLRRLVKHFGGDIPKQLLLVSPPDIKRVTAKCRECHQQQYAAWQAGPHSATYADIFLDEDHNTQRLLMDDCFRCHGMHFQGSIGDLVEPVATKGPWKLKRPEMASEPVIPCLTCHEMHRQGEPLRPHDREAVWSPDSPETVMPPSLALFDRRTQLHLLASGMPVPTVVDGQQTIEMSPDPRQTLCYQCHAPLASAQAGTGDDRTAMGVHEGVGCLACHAGHAMETRASCANCHPRFSNCGMDLEKMNELVRSPESRFDVHTVQCIDCHPKGVPPKRKDHPLAD